ncbi:MAG TPA: hypothetical protein VFE24_03365 [Pirellulales bacterium]|jgi:hypothetical protein|nr:hypothetical protein [Pirellulales bacterium]
MSKKPNPGASPKIQSSPRGRAPHALRNVAWKRFASAIIFAGLACGAALLVRAADPFTLPPPKASNPPDAAPSTADNPAPVPPAENAPASDNEAEPPATIRFLTPDAAAKPAVPPAIHAPDAGNASGATAEETPPPAGSNWKPSRDPTQPSRAIRELLEQENAKKNGIGPNGAARTPAAAALPDIPELRLKGRIFTHEKPPIAILEIAGRNVAVREGMEFNVSGKARGAAPTQLKILKVTANEVQIELVNRKQTISIN